MPTGLPGRQSHLYHNVNIYSNWLQQQLWNLSLYTLYVQSVQQISLKNRSQYCDSLRAGRSVDRISVGAKFSAPVKTGSGNNPASYTMGTGSLSGVKRPERDVTHSPHLLSLWTFVAWSRVNFNLYIYFIFWIKRRLKQTFRSSSSLKTVPGVSNQGVWDGKREVPRVALNTNLQYFR